MNGCAFGGPAGISELTEMDHLVHGHRQVRLTDRSHLVLEPRRHRLRRPIEARLPDLFEPCKILRPEVTVGSEDLVEGRVLAASSVGVEPWPKSGPQCSTGFGSPNRICGMLPWPRRGGLRSRAGGCRRAMSSESWAHHACPRRAWPWTRPSSAAHPV